MTQTERLNYLVEAFIADSEAYRQIRVPEQEADRRRILRSLMNIRMPGEMAPETIAVHNSLFFLTSYDKI